MTDPVTLEMLMELIQQYRTRMVALDSAIVRDVKWLIDSASRDCDTTLKEILNFPSKDKNISEGKMTFLRDLLREDHPNTRLVEEVFASISKDLEALRKPEA